MDFSSFDQLIDQLAKQLHKGTLKPEDLSKELVSKTFEELDKSAAMGYGKLYYKLPADGKGKLPLELQKNIYMFSGAKTYAQLRAINDLLYDQSGKLRPFNEFAQLARQTNRQYNLNWLQAEYQTARTAAQMAQKWESFQETIEYFPNLKFRTVGDDRVRDEHKSLDGTIRPINDVFWKRYFPPLDWRCRCDVVQTAETPNQPPKEMPAVKFKGNVGVDGEIFTSKGNFFKLMNTDENAVRNVEIMKLNAPNRIAYKKNRAQVAVNIFTDPKDYENNLEVAMHLVKQNDDMKIVLRPHLNGRVATGIKNPEYLINNKLGELKIPESTDYTKSLSKANKQECEIVVIDLSLNNDTVENALESIKKLLSYTGVHPNVKEVYIISKDKKKTEHYIRKKAD